MLYKRGAVSLSPNSRTDTPCAPTHSTCHWESIFHWDINTSGVQGRGHTVSSDADCFPGMVSQCFSASGRRCSVYRLPSPSQRVIPANRLTATNSDLDSRPHFHALRIRTMQAPCINDDDVVLVLVKVPAGLIGHVMLPCTVSGEICVIIKSLILEAGFSAGRD